MAGVTCFTCNKIFSKQSNLNRHIRNVHNSKTIPVSYDKSVWNYKCLESECNNSYPRNESLVSHLQQVHNKMFHNIEEFIFTSKSEFDIWKTKLETDTKSNYVVSKTRSSPKGDIIYYNCNRTRTGKQSITDARNRARALKSKGSCKLPSACTSQIKLIQHGNKLIAYLQGTHYGHDVELVHLRISKDDKAIIASKLITGVAKSRILDSVHDKVEDCLKRIDVLTSKDIDNIKRSFNIELKDGKRHNNDAVSLDLWVQECLSMSEDENPILFYKKQGESSDVLSESDFCIAVMTKFQKMMLQKFGKYIITIDGTHGLNNYDFELTTLMIVDEFGQGFPAAFMFSNRKDTSIYEIFFQNILKKVGHIMAKTFMSDITQTFYSAWCRIMGPVTNRLYCSWHIDRAWQVNLTKIPDKEKRSAVYKMLKILQEEQDEKEFKTKLVSFLNLLLEDKDTKTFGQYFMANYANNYEQWAYCFRKFVGINTNMRLESMHKTIKYFYLKRKTIKRLDKGLHTVLKYVRSKSMERIIKLMKGKTTIYHSRIFKRHQSALNCDLAVEVKDEKSWIIGERDKFKYFVTKLLDSSCCRLDCRECKICLHMYSCSCSDFVYKFNICKHIHFIQIMFGIPTTINKNDSKDVPEELSKETDDFVSALKSQTNQFISLKNNLFCKISETFVKLQNVDLDNLSDSTVMEVHKHLNVLSNLIDLPKMSNTSFEQSKNEALNH